jgi:hypothetical protein
MPTRKIADTDVKHPCMHPEHNPPGHRVYESGVYEHTCPKCGEKQTFIVGPKPIC